MHYYLLALLIILTGCGNSSSQNDHPDQEPVESTPRYDYQCLSGSAIQAAYPSDSTAVVEYDGQTLQMSVALSASGARYIGDDYVWWTKGNGPGSEGTLYH